MCRFCDEYNVVKNGMEDFMNNSVLSEDSMYDIWVALVVRTWNKNVGKKRGSTVTGHKFKISYCPVCGTKLKKSKKKAEVVSE